MSWDNPAAAIVVVHLTLAGFPLAAIDATTGTLPRRQVYATYPTTVMTMLLAAAVQGPHLLIGVAAGASILWVFYLILAWLGGVGAGDVRLAPVLGAHLGYSGLVTVLVGTAAAFVIGALVVIALAPRRPTTAFGQNSASRRIPFGPALIGGAVVALLV
ncbi:prepilin peptidase [Pseudonocardia sp. TRM90224]|uniref:prepilin peptidase n=1 Tax=Pseudonocardia sp. TRM90224 TaxID=2812678 RepID=UPI001E557945|nr:A24 family peptidase [Pseudonocardia sp. TRM90224]